MVNLDNVAEAKCQVFDLLVLHGLLLLVHLNCSQVELVSCVPLPFTFR